MSKDPEIQILETSIKYIQHLLGHASSKNDLDLHTITTKGFDQTKSPMDKLDF